jgi:hypothetical protein
VRQGPRFGDVREVERSEIDPPADWEAFRVVYK